MDRLFAFICGYFHLRSSELFMAKKIFAGCGMAFFVLAALISILGRTLLKPAVKTERSETVTRGDVEIKVVETGTIEPLSKVDVKSKVAGRILQLFVDEGYVVKQGQVLATVDPQQINSQVEALRAQLAAAQARLAEARKTTTYQQSQTATGIDQYVQNLAAARARLRLAEKQAGIQPKLTGQSIAIARANLEAAQATLKAQQDSLNLLVTTTHPNAVVSAQSAFDTAKAQANNAHLNLDRQRNLLNKGYVSQQVVDSAETESQVADAQLRDAKEKLDRIRDANRIEEENARSQVANAQGQVHQAEAALEQAQSDILPLTRQDDLANARAAYRQAAAQLAAAQSGRTQDLMKVDEVTAAAAGVRQIQHQLDDLLVTQQDTTLVAPMAGVIAKRYVEKGDLITSATESFSSGTPVVQVADLHTMLVKINVNEVDINKIKPGMLTEVSIDASRGTVFTGHVYKVSPAALTDSSSSTTSSASSSSTQSVIRFPVQIRIDHADPRLKPGMSAHCSVIVARRNNVLRVPTNCIYGADGNTTVQAVTQSVRDGRPVEVATSHPVQVGLRGDDYVELFSGVTEGEKVRPAPYNGPPRKTIEMNNGP